MMVSKDLGGKMLHKNVSRLLLCLMVLFVARALRAQEPVLQPPKPQPPQPTSTYKLDYVFSENQDGKKVNARSYSTLVRVRERGSIRLGSRIPVAVGAAKDGSGNQIQYMDIGVNLDCRIAEELDSGIDLFTNAEVTSLTDANRVGNPVVRQSKIQVESIVPAGKQVLLTSADEVDGTRRLQLEVTATKVK
jgi:hypothetical protein